MVVAMFVTVEKPLLKDYLPKHHCQILLAVVMFVMVEKPLLKDYLPKYCQNEAPTSSYLFKKKNK